MIRFLIVVTCNIFLLGCASIDVSPNVKGLSDAFVLTANSARSELAESADAERTDARALLIEFNRPVYELNGACDLAQDRSRTAVFDCQLVDLSDATYGDIDKASHVLAAIASLEEYLKVISAISNSNSADEIGALTGQVLGALSGEFSLPELSANRQSLVSNTTGFLLDQQRLSALRTSVRRADSVIEHIVERIAIFYENNPHLSSSDAGSLFATLQQKHAAMLNAQLQGDSDLYAAAIAEFKTAFDRYAEAAPNSTLHLMRLFRAAHADLLNRLNNPTEDEIIAALERLQTLRELAQD